MLFASPALAHPHIFIESTLELRLDDKSQLTDVHVIWTYDAFYTLMLLGDLGLDPDGDGVLTANEQAALLTAESTWDPKYEGDTYGIADRQPVKLGPPRDFAVSLQDGKITSSHLRPLVEPLPMAGQTVSWKSYDPFYYAAFTLSGGAVVKGSDACTVTYVAPDLNAAYVRLDGLLYGPEGAGLTEGEFPPVGADFADEARVTCAAR